MKDYSIRSATRDDHDRIYALKAEDVRPYVERIWGWDEDYQRKDFENDWTSTGQFYVVETEGGFAGFLQCCCGTLYYEVAELHLLPEYRGQGVGSHILRRLQTACAVQGKKMRIGCFKENKRAKALYLKLGFRQIEETDTHYILEYPLRQKITGQLGS